MIASMHIVVLSFVHAEGYTVYFFVKPGDLTAVSTQCTKCQCDSKPQFYIEEAVGSAGVCVYAKSKQDAEKLRACLINAGYKATGIRTSS